MSIMCPSRVGVARRCRILNRVNNHFRVSKFCHSRCSLKFRLLTARSDPIRRIMNERSDLSHTPHAARLVAQVNKVVPRFTLYWCRHSGSISTPPLRSLHRAGSATASPAAHAHTPRDHSGRRPSGRWCRRYPPRPRSPGPPPPAHAHTPRDHSGRRPSGRCSRR